MNLHDTDYQIKFKSGLNADVNSVTTQAIALEAEPHWTTDTKRLFVFDGNKNKGCIMEHVNGAPASSSSPGNPGEIAYDADYLYVCVSTDTWKRIAFELGW